MPAASPEKEPFKLPPCTKCGGYLFSTGDGLQCANCSFEPNLQRLGISREGMDPLRLLLRMMAFMELIRSAQEEMADAARMLDDLMAQASSLSEQVAAIKVRGRLRPMTCKQCGVRCGSAQGLISHQRACQGSVAS